jgi:hypothetical protein
VGCVREVQRSLLPPTRYFPSLEIPGLLATCDFSRPHWVSTGGVQGGGEVRKNGAHFWGWIPHYTWFPTSADRIHTLAHLGADTSSASAAGGKREGGRRDTKAGPGATRIGGRGTRASSGLLTPVVFQIPPWVASSAERASHIRERKLSRRSIATALFALSRGKRRPPLAKTLSGSLGPRRSPRRACVGVLAPGPPDPSGGGGEAGCSWTPGGGGRWCRSRA